MTTIEAANAIGKDLRKNIVHNLQLDRVIQLEKLEIFVDGTLTLTVTDVTSDCWIPELLKLSGDITFNILYI